VQLQEAETNQNHDMYTNKHWPINGGINICFQNPNSRGELFLTGHEDGSVRFWDARNASLVPIYEFNIAQFFVVGGETNNPHFESVGEESPIFHKTGVFHPHIDDPRLAIKQIALCPSSGTLVVASTSGLIVVCRFNNEGVNREVEVTTLTVLNDLDGFIWRGIDQLIPKAGLCFFLTIFFTNYNVLFVI
jgi:lethal(2) giant larvae protein